MPNYYRIYICVPLPIKNDKLQQDIYLCFITNSTGQTTTGYTPVFHYQLNMPNYYKIYTCVPLPVKNDKLQQDIYLCFITN